MLLHHATACVQPMWEPLLLSHAVQGNCLPVKGMLLPHTCMCCILYGHDCYLVCVSTVMDPFGLVPLPVLTVTQPCLKLA
jgi:hypothetical protein